MTDIMLTAALEYAAAGWPVFPCAKGTKEPAIKDGNGFRDATTDAATIRKWWAEYPHSNIGFAPHGAGIAVIDVDVKDGQAGPAELEALEYRHGRLPNSVRQDSPSGGYHLFFKTSEALPNNKLSAGIDVRCAGGYILLEPSKVDGKGYIFVDGWTPADGGIADLPAWVPQAQQERSQGAVKASGEVASLPYTEPDEVARAAIFERLTSFLMRCPKANLRYQGKTDGLSDTSGSAMDFSMCALLKIAGFDYSEVRFILEQWPYGSSDPQRNTGNRYWERLWHRTSNPEQATADDFTDVSDPGIWPDPVDLFATDPVPAFPLEAVPAAIRDYAQALSKQTGFDAGGYAFCALVAASGLINHSLKMDVTASWKAAAVLWGGLTAEAGGGKDPVMTPMVAPVVRISNRLMADSQQDIKRWQEASKAASKAGETPPPRPPWRQRVINDTTVEAAAILLSENDGLLLQMSEITEFIGRMDAYSGGGKGASKDRGVWLRARDGGEAVINRASNPIPHVVRNFSIAILAGIQPEKLAELMGKRGGGSSDGLFQRFLLYHMQTPADADLMADMPDHLPEQYAALFDAIQLWNDSGYDMFPPGLTDGGRKLFNEYLNTIRTIAKNTPAGRFAEHLNKFPAFALNLTLTLHVLECAERQVRTEPIPEEAGDLADIGYRPTVNKWQNTIETETLQRALTIMRVLYRHSEAAYQYLDEARPEVRNLAVAAGDAALAKGWKQASMGDLTRHATGWRAADAGLKQEALNLLIELGWLLDVTPPAEPGRRGRPSEGLFAINPKAHTAFQHHAAHVVAQRRQRFEAIQQAAMARTA